MSSIYVGNLPYSCTEQDLEEAFSAFGEVKSVSFVKDRETKRFRGFGFVEMPNANEAAEAIEGMNGYEMDGRELRVSEARERQPRKPGARPGQGAPRGGDRRPARQTRA